MPDYRILRFLDGDIGIYVESDWAALRGRKEWAHGMIKLFATQDAALHFVHEGEAEGYTFEGKEYLGDRPTYRRCNHRDESQRDRERLTCARAKCE